MYESGLQTESILRIFKDNLYLITCPLSLFLSLSRERMISRHRLSTVHDSESGFTLTQGVKNEGYKRGLEKGFINNVYITPFYTYTFEHKQK